MSKKFFTLTDEYSEYTNSRSTRYPTLGMAQTEALKRLRMRAVNGSHSNEGIYILEAIQIVRPRAIRVVIDPQIEAVY